MTTSRPSKEEITPFIRFLFKRLVPWGFIILGAWMFFSGTCVLFRAKESMTWPTADGRVVESAIAYRPAGDEGRIPYVSLEYVFTVAGKAHSGGTVAFAGHDYSTFSDMKKTVDKYPKDKAVRVRYLPADPDVCVLEPGIHPEALLYPASGLFFIAAAIVLPILLRRVMDVFHPDHAPSGDHAFRQGGNEPTGDAWGG